jgi:hypothetical protein
MSTHPLVKNILIGVASGYAGLLAMDWVTTKLQETESEADKEQEKRVSKGVAFDVAAKDLSSRVGVQLDDKKAATVGSAFHTGLGLGAGILYVLLRDAAGMNPAASASLSAGTLFLGIDEGLNSAMGWSAPPTAYPASTHIRGAAGHATLGAVTATVAEFLRWALS